ncbi:hypothetical protein [Oryza sativa Japonica Group]|uniref:Uncharacterized protein n=1 Tax=Oryza sativa subsp. japonica TaxID=39947 RepID=Q5ZDX1_ORYSJ|nr:hypothetical protein [Oryza sativa Japonica Group]
MVSRLSSGTATVVGGDSDCRRAHHAYLAAAATRPEAPIASSPNARLCRLIARDDLAEATRLVDRSRGETPDAAVVKTNAGEVHEPKHQAHTAMDGVEVYWPISTLTTSTSSMAVCAATAAVAVPLLNPFTIGPACERERAERGGREREERKER